MFKQQLSEIQTKFEQADKQLAQSQNKTKLLSEELLRLDGEYRALNKLQIDHDAKKKQEESKEKPKEKTEDPEEKKEDLKKVEAETVK